MDSKVASSNTSKNKKKANLFIDRLATILLVQTKLLPPATLGIKDLKDKI